MTDYSQLNAQIVKSQQRLAQLERDADEIEGLVTDSAKESDATYAHLGSEVQSLEQDILSLQSELADIVKRTSSLALRFREIVKTSDVQILQRRIDLWPLESFAHQKWFENLISSELASFLKQP